MYIQALRIRNFRRLKNARIDLQKDISIFVGANNSGNRNLYPIDERLRSHLVGLPPGADADEGSGDEAAVTAFLSCPASQTSAYEEYVMEQSPF